MKSDIFWQWQSWMYVLNGPCNLTDNVQKVKKQFLLLQIIYENIVKMHGKKNHHMEVLEKIQYN
jgi:hypothetical protein